jgi:hypothetical protein
VQPRVVEYLQHADPPRVATSGQLRRPQSQSFRHISFAPPGRAVLNAHLPLPIEVAVSGSSR